MTECQNDSQRISLLQEANRNANAAIGDIANECSKYASQMNEAKAEAKRLRDALFKISLYSCGERETPNDAYFELKDIARAALSASHPNKQPL